MLDIITWVGLVTMFAGMFLIGFGAESKAEDKKVKLLASGFGVFMISVLALGYVVVTNTLSAP